MVRASGHTVRASAGVRGAMLASPVPDSMLTTEAALRAPIRRPPLVEPVWELRADVVVVGVGAAGLSAARGRARLAETSSFSRRTA